jgi:uncharacterized protein (TIGR03435 family)
MLLNACSIPPLKRPATGFHRQPNAVFCSAVLLAIVFSVLLAFGAYAQPAPAASQGERPAAFEVVAVKLSNPDNRGTSWHGTLDRITIENYTLRHLIRVAYGLKSDTQVLGGPDWLDKQHFDIAAKLEDTDATRLKNVNYQVRSQAVQLMLQSLLAERFQLKVNPGERALPVYMLVVGKSGAKLTALPTPKDSDEARNRNHGTRTENGHLTATALSMDSFADYLTSQSDSGDRVVLNRTGLAGDFDFNLNWTEDRGGGIPADAAFPGLFTALEEQLGLELKSDKGSVPVVAVIAASKPVLD